MRRLVIKIGSSSLTRADGMLAPELLQAIAQAVQLAQAQAAQLAIQLEIAIVSSGAVAAGIGVLKQRSDSAQALANPASTSTTSTSPTSTSPASASPAAPSRVSRAMLDRVRPLTTSEKQALAAVGQAQLMQAWAQAFDATPVAQFLLSAGDIRSRSRFVNAKQALDAAFKLGVIPIINENDTVATAELKLGDNDTLSAWVAYLIDAEALLLLTDVAGLYDADPRTHADAKLIPVIADIAEVAHVAGNAGSTRGTGGMRTKLRAAQIATEAGIETTICHGGGAGIAAWLASKLFDHPPVGTKFLPKASPQSAKRSWISHQNIAGELHIDLGASQALRGGKSLLASGIVKHSGAFQANDVLRVLDPQGQVIAQGLSHFSAAEIALIIGKQSNEIAEILGPKRVKPVIHRDQLVMM